MLPIDLVHCPCGNRGLDERSHIVGIAGLARFAQPCRERVASGGELGERQLIELVDRTYSDTCTFTLAFALALALDLDCDLAFALCLLPFPLRHSDLVCHTRCIELTPDDRSTQTWRRHFGRSTTVNNSVFTVACLARARSRVWSRSRASAPAAAPVRLATDSGTRRIRRPIGRRHCASIA